MFFSWSEILSIISFILSSISALIGIYIFLQRRFRIKIKRQKAFIPNNFPTVLHLIVTVVNKSSLPISIIGANLNSCSAVHKQRIIQKHFENHELIPGMEVKTSKFPINIAPYESADIRLEFNSDKFEIKDYRLTLLTSRKKYSTTLNKSDISNDPKNADF